MALIRDLGALAMKNRLAHEDPHFEVIACIAARGFKLRREDTKKLLNGSRSEYYANPSCATSAPNPDL
jgi:hypothetical protein